MSTCLYLVIKVLGSWYVDCEGKPYGPCETPQDAIHGAHKLIEVFGDPERPAEIWMPDESGKMQKIWSSGAPEEDSSADGLA